MQSWFEKQPGLLQDELNRLEEIGVQYSIDKEQRKNGFLVINVIYIIEDDELHMSCHYPSSYPYFPFEIKCENFPEGRHLEPSGKLLCLFADKHNSWDIKNDSLAGILENQVRKIYFIHKNPDVVSESENELEGYQISGQLRTEENSIIVTVNETPPEGISGKGEIVINEISKSKHAIQGCFSLAHDSADKVSFSDNSNYHKRFSKKLPIRWVKLDKGLKSTNAEQILEQAVSVCPKLKVPAYHPIGKIKVDIVAVCFSEETTRNEIEYNWTFVARRQWKDGRITRTNLSLIKSDHINPKYLLARTPNLMGLENRKIAIIGLGALGSHVAWQLARSGIKKFNLLDKDYLQAGNLQRWLNALQFIGMDKSTIVANLLFHNYIDIEAKAYKFEVGSSYPITAQTSGKYKTEEEFLVNEVLSEVDVVIDCTAMLNVNQYLAKVCQNYRIDYVWCSATNGAWGGLVGRSPAIYDRDVWLEFNMDYGNGHIPPIPTEPSDFVQPKGCFHPTFTGTGFDLDTISIMATRMVISMLQADKYGQFDFDVAVLEQFQDGLPIATNWKTYSYKNGKSVD